MNSFTLVNDAFLTNRQGEEELEDNQQHEDEETKTSPSKPPATAFTISFDDDSNNDEGRKSLGIKDPIRQFAPRKSFARSSRRSTRSTPATSYGAEEDSIESSHTMNSLPLTDSAAYLINKMFSSEEPSPESPAQNVDLCQDVSVPRHHTNGDATREDIDALSEAGTYTLGVEKKNYALEHARKMIDNVFGVQSKPPAFTSTTTFSKKKMSPGSVPSSPKPSRVSAGTATGSNSNLSGSGDGENDLRQRTFTRSKSRRSSLDTQSNHGNSSRGEAASSSSFERSYKMKPSSSPSHTAATTTHQSTSSKSSRRNRFNSFSSSKSSGSNKTVDVKKPTQFTNSNVSNSRYSSLESPQMRRKAASSSLERGKGDSSESLASFDSDERVKDSDINNSSSSGLKLNRAFALRRARLGIETPGVSVTLTDEKQKKNQEKRARDERNFIAARSSAPSTSSFSRDDGGRFSLRVTRGKPPLPGSCPATPTRKPRDLSQRKVQQHHQTQQGGRFDLVRLSPASSTNSIPNNNSYQRRSSFGPHPQSDHHSSLSSHSREFSERLREMRGLNAFQVSKRMFSTKPYQQQQVSASYDMRGNKQQANVAPMKRTPCVQQPNVVEPPSHLPQLMTSSYNEQSIRSEPVTGTYASQEGAGAICNSRPQAMIQRRMLSSLDNLVVSAILQLSLKIRRGMREWLESEKLKHPTGSETRLMIEEILPQVSNIEPPTPMSSFENSLSSCNESVSKDLSSILKNLKKVEQSMEGKCDFVDPI